MPKSTANAAAAAVSNSQTKAAAAVSNPQTKAAAAVSNPQTKASPHTTKAAKAQNAAANSINLANSTAQANAQADTAQAVSSPQNAAENLANSAMQTKAAQAISSPQTQAKPAKPPKSTNKNLHNAKVAKKDEFYTQLCDIENELKHYKKHFAGKVVYCNCDDPLASNFFKYFFLNFKHLGLKELITTCYKSQNFRDVSSEDSPKKAYCIRISDTQDDSGKSLDNKFEELLSLSLSRPRSLKAR